MSEQFRPPEQEDESTAVARRADKVDRALDASNKPVTRFSGRLSRWFAGVMGAAAVAGGAPAESRAEKIDSATAQAQLEKMADARSFDFDSAEERAQEKVKADAVEKHHAYLLEMNTKPMIDADAVAGTISVDRRVAERNQNGKVLAQVLKKDSRETLRGRLTDLLNKPVYFGEVTATSSIGEEDADGYVHDVAVVRNYYPATVSAEAKTVPLAVAINLGKDDPRLGSGAEDARILKQLGDNILDNGLVRSSDPHTLPEDGKVVALDSKTQGAVLEGDKTKPRHRVVIDRFKAMQPISFRVEKRGENFWLVGVRYEVTPKTTVASAEQK